MTIRNTLLKLHKYNFLLVLVLALVTLVGVVKLQCLPQVQFLLVLCLTFFYLTWALLYHKLDKTLTLEVMLEYILTALLALVVAYGALI